MTNGSIKQALVDLRAHSGERDGSSRRAAAGFAAFADLWESRLAEGWTPPLPDGSPFPWAMVRLSLAALLPGFRDADKWLAQASPVAKTAPGAARAAALFLAGNTPLLAWQPLAACLLAGYAVYVKMSRDEILWPRLFVEALEIVDAEIASRIFLDVWPGDGDPRTAELAENADAVIAYGSDRTIANLRALTPSQTLFFDYGHAVSVGIIGTGGKEQASGFARDILMYGQQGCLSPVALFVENAEDNPGLLREIEEQLAFALREEVNTLQVSPVTDVGVARAVRQARDIALFSDNLRVLGDETLCWTILAHEKPVAISPPISHGVIELIPLHDPAHDLGAALGAVRGRVSCIGVAGEISPDTVNAIKAEGVSRICGAGEMQMPLLDWPNAGFDLLAVLQERA